MELRHLRYFVAVAEEQNITRAAARLHVSQPPLSRQIRDLEEELGAPLLERTARSVRLTAAGWAFLEECYRVLRAADEAVRVAQRVSAGGKGQLRLGYAPGPTHELLREVLRAWRAVEPGLKVALHDLTTVEMLAGLRAGSLDAALMVDPCPPARRGLVFEKLSTNPVVAVVSAEHRLAKRKTLRTSDAALEPQVILSRKEYPEHLETIAHALGVEAGCLRIAEECDSGSTLFAAVEAGSGLALIARALATRVGPRLKIIPLIPTPEPTVVGLAYPAGAANRLTHLLADAARKAAQALREK
ncbi:MAG: LysR substrate-binding domain-containing protein [Verrucomicrobiota bacterium]